MFTTSQSSEKNLKELRQTAAELLAYALCNLFPGTKLIDSHVSDIGFHTDVVLPQPIDDHSIAFIEERVRFLASSNIATKKLEMVRNNAIGFLQHHGQPLLAEKLLYEANPLISLLMIDSFVDLCPIDILPSQQVKGFKILSWQEINYSSSKENLKAIRFCGTAFYDTKSLKTFLKKRQEAQFRDHIPLVEDLQLCSPIQNSGCWIWQSKGLKLRELLKELSLEIQQPQKFSLNSFPPLMPNRDKKSSGSCPFVFSDSNYLNAFLFQKQSFQEVDLPLRYQNISSFSNASLSSQAVGLLNPLIGEMDLFHIFCTPNQLRDELISSLQFIYKIIKIFGFEHQWILYSRYPSQCLNKEGWKSGVEALKDALSELKIDYLLDKQEETQYGPRVEIKIADALGRFWNGPFTLIDVTHPHALQLRYKEGKGKESQPVAIIRSLFGIVERFVAVLIEHTAGDLPLWLAPEQFRVIPLNASYANDAVNVCKTLESHGFRGSIDSRLTFLSDRVHKAEKEHIPYILIIGEQEVRKNLITVRSKGHVENSVTMASLLEQLQENLKHSLQQNT